jgi:hypothetical protein
LHDAHDLHDHDEEDLLAGVPEDILAQMPDDLLQAPGKATGGKFGSYSKSHDEDDENEGEGDEPQQPQPRKSALEQLGIHRDAYAGKASMHDADSFEDDSEENPLSRKLSQNISAVAQVVQDMDSRARSGEASSGFFKPVASRFDLSHNNEHAQDENDTEGHTSHEHAEKHEHAVHAQQPDHRTHENGDDVQGQKHEVHHEHDDNADNVSKSHSESHNNSDADDVADEVPFEVNDPFETEYDPATGVYRLKVKAAAPVENHEHSHTQAESKEDDADEVGSSHQAWSGQQLTIPVYEGNPQSENTDQSPEPIVGHSHGGSEHDEDHDAESESEAPHQEVAFNHHDAS